MYEWDMPLRGEFLLSLDRPRFVVSFLSTVALFLHTLPCMKRACLLHYKFDGNQVHVHKMALINAVSYPCRYLSFHSTNLHQNDRKYLRTCFQSLT